MAVAVAVAVELAVATPSRTMIPDGTKRRVRVSRSKNKTPFYL